MDNLALATILLPFAGALLALLSSPRLIAKVAILFSGLAALTVIGLAFQFSAAGKVAHTFSLLSLFGLSWLGLTIDRLSVLIAIAVVTLGFLMVVYSSAYMSTGNRDHPHEVETRYYAYLLTFIGAMAGLVFSSTLIGQLVFFEITGACSWGLIGYYQQPKPLAGAIKALLITHVASLGLYFAVAFLFAHTGNFELTSLAALPVQAKTIIFLGILFASWGKSAQLPMHMWLPDAMEAPTPISAYLHAASMVKVGVYIFARAIFSAGGNVPPVIGWIGAIMATVTLLYGFAMYLPQKDMKRLLAYSTITQLSYIFLALSMAILGSKEAFNGAIMHIFNHAYAKSLFFLVAGALSYTCATRMLPSIRGLLKKLPLLGIGFCVAALAITGVPPFNGFFSKFVIFSAGFELGRTHWLVLLLILIAMLESVASFAWFLSWFGKVVPGEESEAVATAAPVPPAIKFVLIVLIIMCVASSPIAASWMN